MRKIDEMGIMATFKAMRFGWIIVAISLVTWGGLNYYKGLGMTFPMILFILQVSFTMLIRAMYLAKMDDKSQLSQLLMIPVVLIIILLVGIILFLGRV